MTIDDVQRSCALEQFVCEQQPGAVTVHNFLKFYHHCKVARFMYRDQNQNLWSTNIFGSLCDMTDMLHKFVLDFWLCSGQTNYIL